MSKGKKVPKYGYKAYLALKRDVTKANSTPSARKKINKLKKSYNEYVKNNPEIDEDLIFNL